MRTDAWIASRRRYVDGSPWVGEGCSTEAESTRKTCAWRRVRWWLAIFLTLGLQGCVTPIPGASSTLLSFLHEGSTKREEVLLKLGQPSASFEQERIFTYRIGEDPKQGQYVITPKAMMPWQRVHYSLVLIFDEGGTLTRHNLVTVD